MNVIIFMLLFFQQGETPPPQEEPNEEEFVKKISYIMGNQYGQYMSKEGIKLDLDLFTQGLSDGLEKKSQFDDAEMQSVMRKFQTDHRKKKMEDQRLQAEKNKQKAATFLAANKAKPGVVALDSGLQYKVLTEGSGPKPSAADRVKVHYRGRFMDGTEFDSSFKRNEPATFGVKGVIKGWTEVLQLMNTGSKWEVYIPADLGYGPRGNQNIPPNSLLVFEIELLEVVPQSKPKTEVKKEDQ